MTTEGELAIVLHTHMPYVEGFGTWPFGEEWLWEAVATSYLPLLDVLTRSATPAPLTLSLTPVLCDQLQSPGWAQRCMDFLTQLRPETHRRDIATADDPRIVEALTHSQAAYDRAAERLAALGGDLLGALAPHAAWTSSATHAVLPLVATDAGMRMQLRTGIDAHRRRCGGWDGGLWLPECAHAPWLDGVLVQEGVRFVCVELTDVVGPDEHLRPMRPPAGLLLVPIDRRTIDLVWSERGYPAHPAYRDHHRKTAHHHRAWANDGAPYDPSRAAEAVDGHAADFVRRARERVAGGGLAVCALDTELLGHWWHEGPRWLEAVVEQADAQGLALVPLDDALGRHEPVAAPRDLPVTSWGAGRDLRTWSGPPVAAMARAARDGELRAVAAGAGLGERAARELLALQASDWAFVVSREIALPYGRERAAAHRANLLAALADPDGHEPALRSLAPDLRPAALAGL